MRLAVDRGVSILDPRSIGEQKQLDDLLETVLVSTKGADISARSPKTGESSRGLLGRASLAEPRWELRAA